MSPEIATGFCECGCGQQTKLAPKTETARGWVRGKSQRFVNGHNPCRAMNKKPFSERERWRRTPGGYFRAYIPDHPNANSRGYVFRHVTVAARALGRPIPDGAEVHHLNGVRDDDRPGNLVICQDHAYHHLLHYRAEAIRATGSAEARRCMVCGLWDDPESGDMRISERGRRTSHHRECTRRDQRERYALRRGRR